MAVKTHKLQWQEEMNGVTIDCSLDIAIHPAESSVVMLIVPGVDGTVDGYQNKYVNIANNVQTQHGAAVVRMSNPFITSYHWESNVRRALEYIQDNAKAMAGTSKIEIMVMAHSAGAAIVACIAWEYPNISRLMLINPATKLDMQKIKYGLAEFGGNKITILIGSKDPAAEHVKELTSANETAIMRTFVIEGADHNFSGDAFAVFMGAPHAHLFNQALYL